MPVEDGEGVPPTAIAIGRLLIRRFRAADLGDFLEYQGHPVVREHQPGDAMTDADAARFVAAQEALDLEARGAWHGWAVEHVGQGRVIGDIGIWLPAETAAPFVGDLGFQFDPRHHGVGYAREALEAFVPFALRAFVLDGVTASCDEANTSSWGLMQRLGMRLLERSAGRRQYGATRDAWLRRP